MSRGTLIPQHRVTEVNLLTFALNCCLHLCWPTWILSGPFTSYRARMNHLITFPRSVSLAWLIAFSGIHDAFTQPAQTDNVARAETLLNDGNTGDAISLLVSHVGSNAADARALRLLGRAYYWSGEHQRARTAYQQAVALNPSDASLRLEFGRMLVELLDVKQATEVLRPLLADELHAAEAGFLHGLMEYWEGDWTSAAELFESTLQRNPQHAGARKHLNDIRITTAPSISMSSEYQSDTQPLDRLVVVARAQWNPTPLHTVALRVDQQHASLPATTRQVSAASVEYSQYHASLRFDTEALFGFVRPSFASGIDHTWRLMAGLRPTSAVKVRLRSERAPYLSTLASHSIPIRTTSLGASASWDDGAGWKGEAAFDVLQFPDRNRLRRGSAWLLAPLTREGDVRGSLGYGFSMQDTDENRFVPVVQGGSVSGRYDPYHTPEEFVSHNLLAFVSLALSTTTTIVVNVSYAVSARELAPYFYAEDIVPGRSVIRKEYYERAFHPWNAKAMLAGTLGATFGWSLEGIYWSTAYYDSRHVLLKLSYRFLPSER
jgi:Tfp pilus assembly protein PilF